MKRSTLIVALLGPFLLLTLDGCQQQETPPETGVVEANPAYIRNFGPPPYETKGRAFARVGYLPLQKNHKQVRAVPFFLFSEQEQLRQILDRLTSGDLLLPSNTELYSPFPADVKVTVKSLANDIVTLSLKTEQPWATENLLAARIALTQTAIQFPDITKVKIFLNGQPLSQMPDKGFTRNPQQLSEVGLPALVTIIGMWEKGAEALDEILVEFDRPITVNKFQLYDREGNEVDGEYFTSAFQMAVVIHPKNPERYQANINLRAEWDIIDFLGRSNNGANTLPLSRLEH